MRRKIIPALGCVIFLSMFSVCALFAMDGGDRFADVMTVVKEYRKGKGFYAITLGRLGVSVGRAVAISQIDSKEGRKAMKALRNLHRVTIAYYEDCPDSVAETFNEAISKILDNRELLIGVKEDEENFYLYGKAVEKGRYITDIVVFSPENKALALARGRVYVDDLLSIIPYMD